MKKRTISKKRQKGKMIWRISFAFILILSLSTAGFFSYRYQAQIKKVMIISTYFSRFNDWIVKHPYQSVKQINHNLLASNQKMVEPEIHFEFYAELPKMKVVANNEKANKEILT